MQVLGVEHHACDDRLLRSCVLFQKDSADLVDVFVSAGWPVGFKHVRGPSFLVLLLQRVMRIFESDLQPTLPHVGKVAGLAPEICIFKPAGLGSKYHSSFFVKDKYVSDVWIGCEDLVQTASTSLALWWKLVANIVQEFIRSMVDLLFRNRQHLAEVTLDDCFHVAITLEGLQMMHTQNDENCDGQNDR